MRGDKVLQIRVELMGIEPGIWRRIHIGGECTFWDLHVAIQDAMGWTDSHLHAFRVADPATGRMRYIGLPADDDEIDIEPGWEHGVAEALTIQQPRVLYDYDFGDSWEHAVVLEDILPVDARCSYPRCVAGVRACPPEDVGGVHGYEQFLEAIADPKHEEHDGYLEWVGGAFNPDRFDANSVEFQDPDERWQEVFGEDEGAGLAPAGPPQLEGGFTGDELQRLLLSPFSDDSPLHLKTDLPDVAFEAAPLVRDSRRFLQMLAEEAPLKLTQKGNLPRAAIARLIEAEALGSPWWWEFRAPRDERHAPRATLLRHLAELAGLTRKRHGKLDLTKRGRAAAAGRMPAGELYRLLLDRYVTQYNWAFGDAMPESRWLQACSWYVLYLLQEYGAEKRPVTFYAAKFARAFPFAVQDFASSPYGSPSELLDQAFEWRMLAGFATEFGLALTSAGADDRLKEPCEVWAGPLLSQVMTWRRGTADGAAPDRATTGVVAGPWAQAADDPTPEDVADPTIAEVLAAFLTAQRRRLRSPQTIRKYEEVVERLQRHLDADGPDMLPDDELAVYARYAEEGPAQRGFCEIFGPEWIPPGVRRFLSVFMAGQGTGSAQLTRAAGTVCKKLLTWLEQEGLADAANVYPVG